MPGKRKILLVGVTGLVGAAITDAMVERSELSLRVLVRPGKPDAAAALQARGVEIAEGDVMTPSSLPAAVEGVDAIVTALGNDPRVFVPGHQNLIDAAERSYVSRLVPSDFSVDFFKFDAQENANLAMRKQVVPLFEGRRVRTMHILNGAFMDTQLDPRVPFMDGRTTSCRISATAPSTVSLPAFGTRRATSPPPAPTPSAGGTSLCRGGADYAAVCRIDLSRPW